MALAEAEVAPQTLTYEQYLAEGTVYGRYDILDGVRHFMANPTALHQDVCANIFEHLRAFQRGSNLGRAYMAPRDVRINFNPLRARQPDVLFITHERIGGQPLELAAPFPEAPELVVEVLSPSDTRAMKAGKIADFCMVDVRECWLVSPQDSTVEVLRLTPDGPNRVGIHGAGDTFASLAFPELTVAVADIFDV